MSVSDGFRVPNSAEVHPDYRQAEPDQVDWAIAANERYGVLSGCDYTLNTSSGAVTFANGGFVLNDMEIQQIPSGISVTLQPGGSADRFDLVVWNGTGLSLRTGAPSSDPVFPDPVDGDVVLIAHYAKAGSSTFVEGNLVDKRRLLLNGARGAVEDDEVFLRNVDPDTGDELVSMDGQGTLRWAGGSSLSSDGDGLRIDADLTTPSIQAGTIYTTGNVSIGGTVQAANFLRGSGPPPVGSYSEGTIYQRTGSPGDGHLYIRHGSEWKLIEEDEYPIGTVITSFLTPALMNDSTWLAMDGSTYQKSQVRTEFWDKVVIPLGWNSTGSTWMAPDLRDKYLLGASGAAALGGFVGTNSLSLLEANLPAHKHRQGDVTASGGTHAHGATVANGGSHTHTVSGGNHTHPITDPGHVHKGVDHGLNTFSWFVHTRWGGANKLDAHFSDASHTWTVDVSDQTVLASTGISIKSSGSHSHTLAAASAHTHSATVQSGGDHSHALPADNLVGGGVAVNNRPRSIAVNYYIKV